MDRDSCGLRFSGACDGCQDHSFRLGHQYDSGDYYCVLAHTDEGVIPGKAKPGNPECWYPYGGEERCTDNFEWVSSNGHGVILRPAAEGCDPPESALCIGSQDDGEYYMVVAHTEEGDIPGKSKGEECWYPFGGEERITNNFSYVLARHGNLHDGAYIHLESRHGGHVRVNGDDELDLQGGNGRWATFIVQRNEHDGTLRLQNEHKPHRFIAIKKNRLTTGAGGRYCVFRPKVHKDGSVSFQSVNFPGRHIGFNDDQEPRDPKQTGTGNNARFTIHVKEE